MSDNQKTLFNRLINKLKIKPVALQKRIQRKANKLLITSQEAIFVIAREKGITCLKEFKKLSSIEQSKINNAANMLKGNYDNTSYELTQPLKRILYSNINLDFIKDPFLSDSVKKDAIKMAQEAYPIIYVFENSIRSFIILVMEKEYDADWWTKQMKTKILIDIASTVKSRMQKEEKLAWHGKRGAHPIYYSDFDHLEEIIKANTNVFNKYFSNQNGKSSWLLSRLKDTFPSRNISSHHNPLSKRDFDRVRINFLDILSQFEYIHRKRLL